MDPVVQKTLSTLIGIFLTVIAGLITWAIPYVIPIIRSYFLAKLELVKNNMTTIQLEIFNGIVVKAVQEAEQRGQIKQIEDTATAKKDFALKSVQDELNRLGIPFDVNAADRAIEAAINQNLEHPTPQLLKGEALKLAPLQPRT